MVLEQLDYIAFRVTDMESVVQFYTSTLEFIVVQAMELDFWGTKAIYRVLNLTGKSFYIFMRRS